MLSLQVLLSANTREGTTLLERRRGTVLRELASHKTDLSLNPRPDIICGSSLVASHPFLSSAHFKSLDQERQVVSNIYAIRVCVVVKSMVFRAFIRDRIQYNLPE